MRRLVLAALCAAGLGLACDSSTPTTPTSTCTYSLSTSSFSFQASGGSGSVTVTTQTACSWTASSPSSWLSIVSGASGSGTGAVAFSAAPNTGSAGRSGTLTVAGLPLSVNQDAVSATCEYVVSPDRTSFTKDAATATVTVTAAAGCAWSASSEVPWVTVTSGGQGTGSGTALYSVARNTDTSDRRGNLLVAGRAIELTQAGDTGGCQYSVAPIEFNVCMTVPFELTTTMTTQPSCPWTASPGSSWVTVTSGASGSGPGSIRFRVTDNWDAPRNGVVMVRWPTATAGQNLIVSQAGCFYSVNPSAITIAAAGGPGAFDVIQSAVPNTCGGATQDACLWTVAADVPWITLSRTSGRGDDRVSFTVAPNTSGTARTGLIRVRDKTIVISQPG
jgi:hypothetical protein